MSHNLNFSSSLNRHSFFSVKQKAWHGLGKILDFVPTSKQAIQLSGLDFTVGKKEVFSPLPDQDGNIQFQRVPEKFATYRIDNNKIFGVVGSKYEIVQNIDAFTFFDSIVGRGAAIYETAGCLLDGQIIFITAKLPSCIKVGKDDLIEQYLFLTSTHDGTGSIQAAFTPVRIVCNNTLNAALRHCSNKISIRHTNNANLKLSEAHRIMGISHKLENDLSEIFNSMSKTAISDKQLETLIKQALAPSKEALSKVEAGEEVSAHFAEKVEKCLEYAYSAESQLLPTTEGTVFGAYNAIAGYLQNVKEYKNPESKLRNLIAGTTLTSTQKAFNLCFDLI